MPRGFDHRPTKLTGQHVFAFAGLEKNRPRTFEGVSGDAREDRVVDSRVYLIVVRDRLTGNASPYASDVDNLGKVWFVGHAASMYLTQNQVDVAVGVDVVISFVKVLDVAVDGAVLGEVNHLKA